MFYYIGIFVLVWVLVGFLTGLKLIFIDRAYSEARVAHVRKEQVNDSAKGEGELFDLIFKNSYTFLLCITVCGFIPLIADMVGTVDHIKNIHSRIRK